VNALTEARIGHLASWALLGASIGLFVIFSRVNFQAADRLAYVLTSGALFGAIVLGAYALLDTWTTLVADEN
jgi:hypothetical protein